MKKIYSKPITKVVELDMESLIAQSVLGGGGVGGGEKGSSTDPDDVKGFKKGLWDEEW